MRNRDPYVYMGLGLAFGATVATVAAVQTLMTPPADHIGLDLNQWQCTHAVTVLQLDGDSIQPKGQCTNYRFIIQEGDTDADRD